MDFKGKKILLISVRFFGYEKAIVERLQELGATVDFFDDRPSNSVLQKGIIRVFRSFLAFQIQKYYRSVLKKTEHKKYDYFLLIKGEAIPLSFLKKIKKENPGMKMIAYTYDALHEHPRFADFIPYFDKSITFDRTDALNKNLGFRPLFFLDQYRKSHSHSQPEVDVTFIGSAHTDRYLIGEKVRKACEKDGLTSFFYYYAPGKTALVLKRIFDRSFKDFDLRKASFNKLSHSEISRYYEQTKAVLDINKPFQNGLTMRTFEVLASGKKLITFNEDIKNYPFYHPQNILITNREQPEIPQNFLASKTVSIPEETLQLMSIDSWLNGVFFEDQRNYWFSQKNTDQNS